MCALMSLMPPVMSLMIFLTPTCGGGGGGGGRGPRQFLFWRDRASSPRYLSIGVLHTQNFLIYITGLCIQTKLSHLRTS